ncbi:MAG: hypothetical protein ACR2OV_08505 [Hyphomicrobiaceae bacterium]
MKTSDLAKTLTALAKLATAETARELNQLAEYLHSGKDETLAQRLKKAGTLNGYPRSLKLSLENIQTGFEAAGAKKQAGVIATFLKMFRGRDDVSVGDFIAQLDTPPPKPATKKASTAAKLDHTLARDLADELSKRDLSTAQFETLLARLQKPKDVSTPTLHLIANRFLGNDKRYKGRKAPIDDILKRQKDDAHDRALERALDRVAV